MTVTNQPGQLQNPSVPEKEWETTAETSMEIDLMALIYRLFEKIHVILASALILAVLAGIVAHLYIKPVYKATSYLYVVNSKDSAVNLSDLQLGSYLAKDYEQIFDAWEVHEMVLTNLKLDYSYTNMKSRLSVTNLQDTRILTISFTSTDPQEAQLIANEYAAVSMEYMSDIMQIDRPTLLSSALLPTSSISTSPAKAAVLGFLLGAILAAGWYIVAFVMDDKLKSAEDIQRCADMPVLAIVPKNPGSSHQ